MFGSWRRSGAFARGSGVIVGVSALLAGTVAVVSAPPASAVNTTVSYDTLRTGWDSNEPALSPASVGSSDFGQLFDAALPAPAAATANQIYAQPVTAGGSIVTASEENQVTAVNPVTGAVTWSVNLGPAWPASAIGCGDLTPDVGVTSTPVYDSSTNTVYVSAKVNDGPDVQHPSSQLHALNAATGAELAGWPVTISGSPANDPGHPFDAFGELQRTGLLLLNGSIYLGYAGHCDHKPYVGYIAGVSTSSKKVSLWSAETKLSSSGAGIWQSGGGLVSDAGGSIYFASGNGVSPPPGVGTQPPGTLAESMVRLAVNSDGSMTAKDFFSPANNATLDQDDTDFGAGGPMALPDGYGTAAIPHLMVQIGKDGRVFLLNRDNLGGNAQGANGTDAVLNTQWLRGVWGHPAFWGGDGGYVYVTENGGHLQALRVGKNGAGTPSLSIAGNSAETFGFSSGSPIVTSDGTTSGSALVWVISTDNGTGANARLLAYDPVPVGGVLNLRYSIPIGTVAKFVLPIADNGKIYVATRTGHLLAFGRPATSALNAPPTDFGSVAVGSTGSASATLTASSAVTVSSVSVTGPFGVTPPALPRTLAAGQTLQIPLTFTPANSGATAGQLNVTASTGATFHFDLRGFGTQNGLAATPGTVDFGELSVGAGKQVGVSLQNNGTTALTINGITVPSAPFSAPNLPPAGTTVQPGQAVTATVAFQPTATGQASGSLVVATSQGSLTVPLTGSAVSGTPRLTITPMALDFGTVATGTSVTKTFTVSNTGQVPLTITKAAPPSGDFSVANPLPEGQTLQAGDSIDLSVTLRPTTTGAEYGTYLISSNDGQGQQTVTLTANGGTGLVSWLSGCVEVPGVASGVGVGVVSNPCGGGAGQQVLSAGDSTLRVDGRCLAVKGGAVTNYAAVLADTCDGSAGQVWTWRADDSLFNPQSGLCLTVPNSSATAGTKLQIFTCSKQSGQRWWVQAVRPKGPVTGVNGLCLGGRGGAVSAGTAVQLAACDGGVAQVAQLPGNGTLQLGGSCLDVTSSKFVAGTPVQLWTCNGGSGQQWTFSADNTIRSATGGLCLGTPANATTAGTQLQLTTCTTNNPTQQWTTPTQ